MCARLPVLSGNGGDIVLILDGFELLDDSAVNVLREGDLVWCVYRALTPEIFLTVEQY